MTTSTVAPERLAPTRRKRRGGFSLVELIVAMTLASMALTAVFSTAIFVARSCVATTDYADMTMQARIALERFAQDVRNANDIPAFSATAVTLTVVTSSGTRTVTYFYLPGTKKFYRKEGSQPQQRLITDIESFTFSRYGLATDSVTGQPLPANNALETKQLQLELRSVRSGAAKAAASNNVVSARYILRNKITK